MMPTQPSKINIYELIEQREIEIVFQPIVSIRRQAIVGVEASSRGFNGEHQILPNRLFNLAKIAGLTRELDRLCRTVAVESFLPLYASNPELILFINVESATIDEITTGSDSLINLLQQKRVDPRNVAIEILESEFESSTRLQEVVEGHRHYGFLTVLDDIGVGHSNLSRVSSIKPDILKLDQSLVRNLHTNSHQQEVFKALVGLSERIGGWAIVEGVEQQEEAIHALDFGADMLQGFYLARPHQMENCDSIQLELTRIQATAAGFKRYTLDKTRTAQAQRQQRLEILQAIALQLEVEAAFDRPLASLIDRYPQIESACVLNLAGIQVTETIRNSQEDERQKTVIFKPPAQGTDHSLKEYYYLLVEAQIDPFETNPYVPLPSASLCVTVSTRFKDIEHREFILCLHMKINST